MDHNAERRFNSLSHENLVHKANPMPKAKNILDAKAAVDKEKEVIEKAQKREGQFGSEQPQVVSVTTEVVWRGRWA